MMAKPLKRANGTGSISKESGRRRNPYRVIITLGWDDNGKQIRQTLGYYKTYDEATVALVNYNINPYDVSGGKATFEDVYEKNKDKIATTTTTPKMMDRGSNLPFNTIRIGKKIFPNITNKAG